MTPQMHAARHRHGHHDGGHLHTFHELASRMHPESSRRVGIGEVAVSWQPIRLQTLLGSCVSVCLYNPAARAGGMNHILVPSSGSDCRCTARCGVQAMELLINALMQEGGDRRRFVAKAFGAANVLSAFQTPTVGELNAKFVREFLRTERIPLLAERMGGSQAVRVTFHTTTGKALVSTVDGSRLATIIREETSWYNTPAADRFPADEPIIF